MFCFSETLKSLRVVRCSHIRFQCVLWLSIIMLLLLPFCCCCCISPAEQSPVNPLGTFAQSVQVARHSHLPPHASRRTSFNLQKHKTNRLNLRSECAHRATYQHSFPFSLTHPLYPFSSRPHTGCEHFSVYFWVRFDFCPRLNEVFNQNASAKF